MTLTREVTGFGAGDVGELYRSLADRLEQIVRLDVRAPDAVIEDACQLAWFRLLLHRHRIHRETATAWLARTAVHEALRLVRRDRRQQPLDVSREDGGQPACPRVPATPQELIEYREQIAELRRLPERQQRLVWLHAFGLSYAEIAAHEGCTRRTVDRQLVRARAALRDLREADTRGYVLSAPGRACAGASPPGSASAASDAAWSRPAGPPRRSEP